MYEWSRVIFAKKSKFHDAGGPDTVVSPTHYSDAGSGEIRGFTPLNICRMFPAFHHHFEGLHLHGQLGRGRQQRAAESVEQQTAAEDGHPHRVRAHTSPRQRGDRDGCGDICSVVSVCQLLAVHTAITQTPASVHRDPAQAGLRYNCKLMS